MQLRWTTVETISRPSENGWEETMIVVTVKTVFSVILSYAWLVMSMWIRQGSGRFPRRRTTAPLSM